MNPCGTDTPVGAVDPSEKLRTVYLYPGQLYTASQPLLVSTILGSCIAVCLWDDTARMAGINHYLLPSDPVRGQSDLRYGNIAIERLIGEMVSAGAMTQRMVAKIAGGASILGSGASSKQSIGDQNAAVARQILQKHGIAITAEQTGGPRGRKLLFHTGNGCAFTKEI
ncbi:MAG TPA: chemotaxis protein CheD [Thermoanaerobaculia bacterium]|nr:chemotaxis protein CheD [Thermoanaerobaculia bacterium]